MFAFVRRLILAVSLALPGYAHRGALTRASCDDDFGNSSAALPIADPTISWAFKHYLDCTHRAVWMKFTNPSPNFKFYVGVGIPPLPRFDGLRADSVIIGPGLPELSEADRSFVPAEIQNDLVWTRGMGAVLHRSPADQSTCSHLGATMTRTSEVRNGRCDFFEPFGATHSWRVLDADDNNIPSDGEDYYVAVWLQGHSSGKIGIAFGTWKEDFRTPMSIATPTCTRSLSDSSEKDGEQSSSFPVVACSAASGKPNKSTAIVQAECLLGEVCESPMSGACATNKYEVKMGCGGEKCPVAAKLWDKTNMIMHEGMAINFTGDVHVDFVRGMIPHHEGAVNMCEVLVLSLTCKTWEDSDMLDGLVHFCNHVNLEQQRELAGMRAWLESKQLGENASCLADHQSPNSMGHGGHAGHTGHTSGHTGHSSSHGMDDGHKMSDGCGDMASVSSADFITINRKMHAGMAIKFSCDHDVDFVRSMIPHHAGAVAMCHIMQSHSATSPDAYLNELCANITRLQRAEIAWMSTWLSLRGHSAVASCQTCADGTEPAQPDLPCEDLLPATSFCHKLGGDFFCKCDSAIQQYACGSAEEIAGFALLNMSAECQRSCGLCPADRPPLFHENTCRGPPAVVSASRQLAVHQPIFLCVVSLLLSQAFTEFG